MTSDAGAGAGRFHCVAVVARWACVTRPRNGVAAGAASVAATARNCGMAATENFDEDVAPVRRRAPVRRAAVCIGTIVMRGMWAGGGGAGCRKILWAKGGLRFEVLSI